MIAWTCTSFRGHRPVGTAAVVIAETKESAAKLLEIELAKRYLEQTIEPETMIPLPIVIDMTAPEEYRSSYVRILNDGDY